MNQRFENQTAIVAGGGGGIACASRHHRESRLPGPADTAPFAECKEGAGNPEQPMEAFKCPIAPGRIGPPGDPSGAVHFFAGADAAYVTGQVPSVSGGLTLNG